MQAGVMVLVHDTSSDGTLQTNNVLWKYLTRFFNHKVDTTCDGKKSREITRKMCKSVLRFLCMTLCLMELYKYVKFYHNISKCFGVTGCA